MAGSPMLYDFAYTPQALAYLKRVQPRFRRQIVKRIQGLATNPHPHNSRVVQGMVEGKRIVHRIRSGDYRVLYSVRKQTREIVILDVDHRKNIYR